MAVLFGRETCLTCDTVPPCPKCKSDEQCAMTTQTCSKCPVTYCVKLDDLTGSNTKSVLSKSQITAISTSLSVVVFLALILGFYLLWKKFKPSKGGLSMKNINSIEEEDEEEGEELNSFEPSNNDRHSQAISNVINIAYIPGVTARSQPPKSSRHSIQNSSYSKDTFFSDLDNASFHGGKVASKATRPALVNLDDYNFDDENSESQSDSEEPSSAAPTRNPFTFKLQGSGFPVIEEEPDAEGEEENSHMATKARNLTRYGSLRNKIQPPLSSSSESEDESDSDSDEENIELINKKHKEGTLDADSLNLPSSKGSTLKTSAISTIT